MIEPKLEFLKEYEWCVDFMGRNFDPEKEISIMELHRKLRKELEKEWKNLLLKYQNSDNESIIKSYHVCDLKEKGNNMLKGDIF